MAKPIRRVQVGLSVPPNILEKIDRLAEQRERSRSDTMLWLMERSLEDRTISKAATVSAPAAPVTTVVEHNYPVKPFNRELSGFGLGVMALTRDGDLYVTANPVEGYEWPAQHCALFDMGIRPWSRADRTKPNPNWPGLPFKLTTTRIGTDPVKVHKVQVVTSMDQYEKPEWAGPDEDPFATLKRQ